VKSAELVRNESWSLGGLRGPPGRRGGSKKTKLEGKVKNGEGTRKRPKGEKGITRRNQQQWEDRIRPSDMHRKGPSWEEDFRREVREKLSDLVPT